MAPVRPWNPQTDREAGREGTAALETPHSRSEMSARIGGGQWAMSILGVPTILELSGQQASKGRWEELGS